MKNFPDPVIVKSHHEVLSAWAAYRRTLPSPPRLLTLDHHTDTSRPFRRLINQNSGRPLSDEEFDRVQSAHLAEIRFAEPKSIDAAIVKLNNDEHIVAAIQSDIISSAHVVAHNAALTDLQTYEDHRIACYPVAERLGDSGRLRPDSNCVLETSFLDRAISRFDELLREANEPDLLSTPYILDVDLDYLNTFQSVEPEDAQRFRSLAEGAGLFTIATEPDYVKSCAIDAGLTSEYLHAKLIALLQDL